MLPLALAAGRTSASPGQPPCAEVEDHPPFEKEDPQYLDAKAELLEQFVTGVGVAGEAPAVPEKTLQYIIDAQQLKLRRKMKFWERCREETRNCAFAAGVIAEALRKASGAEGIEAEHFEAAKRAVQAIQVKRLQRANIGIAC